MEHRFESCTFRDDGGVAERQCTRLEPGGCQRRQGGSTPPSSAWKVGRGVRHRIANPRLSERAHRFESCTFRDDWKLESCFRQVSVAQLEEARGLSPRSCRFDSDRTHKRRGRRGAGARLLDRLDRLDRLDHPWISLGNKRPRASPSGPLGPWIERQRKPRCISGGYPNWKRDATKNRDSVGSTPIPPTDEQSAGMRGRGCSTCASTPIGRGAGLRHRWLRVRISPRVPIRSDFRGTLNLLETYKYKYQYLITNI